MSGVTLDWAAMAEGLIGWSAVNILSSVNCLLADPGMVMTARTRRHPQCRRQVKSPPGFACSDV
jgi:hypothetical protein